MKVRPIFNSIPPRHLSSQLLLLLPSNKSASFQTSVRPMASTTANESAAQAAFPPGSRTLGVRPVSHIASTTQEELSSRRGPVSPAPSQFESISQAELEPARRPAHFIEPRGGPEEGHAHNGAGTRGCDRRGAALEKTPPTRMPISARDWLGVPPRGVARTKGAVFPEAARPFPPPARHPVRQPAARARRSSPVAGARGRTSRSSAAFSAASSRRPAGPASRARW